MFAKAKGFFYKNLFVVPVIRSTSLFVLVSDMKIWDSSHT